MRRFSLAFLLAFAPSALVFAGGLAYPTTKKVDQTDEYHGTKVADPYRWLEDDARTSSDVANWVEAQNKVTFAYLEGIPQREAIKKRLTDLWNYERYSAPVKFGGKYFYSKNDGLQNQSVLYVMDSLTAEPRMLLDPNTLAKDGTVALAGASYSEDGKYLAYGLAASGSDWNEWKVRDVATGKDLDDHLKWVKFSGASWMKDGSGFFYSRFDAPKDGEAFQQANINQQVYFHKVGTPQSDDKLVYKRPDHPKWTFGSFVTEDGEWLITSVSEAGVKNLLFYAPIMQDGTYPKPTELISEFEADYSFIGNDGPVFYIRTDSGSPKGRVIAIDTRKPAKAEWKVIVPEAAETLQGVDFVGNMLIASYLKDATTRVRMFEPSGKHVRDVEFPGLGAVGGFGGHRTDTETFYGFTSFTAPPVIHHYDMASGKSTVFKTSKVKFDPAQYETKQVFFNSKDGTKIPMFITSKKGIKLDGQNPTLLYAYGGFNISMTPSFSVANLAWMEMGGVYALPNLRGGGEYGEDWHKAGTKTQKQNVFDDFIAAAEWLIANKYTSTPKLAIFGGSNGGLLVGACMTQRPDLFGACIPAVGVMDMLRFHQFTAGRFWTEDYGRSDDTEHPEQFKALYAYSPYHVLMNKGKVKYPPTLITTADTDDRVVPGHSFKFAAAIQEMQAGDAPVVIRIETKAGHGAGKPTSKIIEEAADRVAFLVKNLGVESAPKN